MNEKMKAALEASIEKWEGLVKSHEDKIWPEKPNSYNCPLCIEVDLQIDINGCCSGCCSGCPIFLKTGRERCDMTPYINYAMSYLAKNSALLKNKHLQLAKFAQEEVNFLKSLRENDAQPS